VRELRAGLDGLAWTGSSVNSTVALGSTSSSLGGGATGACVVADAFPVVMCEAHVRQVGGVGSVGKHRTKRDMREAVVNRTTG
jgi:hypothetical protein